MEDRELALKQVQKKLEVEQKRWTAAGLPDVGVMWRFGDSEFAMRCEMLVMIEILQEKFDIDDNELNLRFKLIILREMKKLFPIMQQQRAEQLRQQIVRGVNPIDPRGNHKAN